MKSTKKALVVSILSMVLCATMLLGTTFAWFTDSVTSGKNVIEAGNLDIKLEYSTDMSSWTEMTKDTNVFAGSLWEPGFTEVVYLKVSNVGTLALKYNLGINIAKETKGKNVAGEEFKLSDYIMFGTETDVAAAYADRAAAVGAVSANAKAISAGYTATGNMLSGETKVVALVVYMPETVGDAANYRETKPEIELGIEVLAAQLTKEKDAFDDQYDVSSPWLGGVADVPAEVENVIIINSAEQLAGFAKAVNEGNTYSGKTIKLGKDIDLNNIAWTPISVFNGTFDGQGHTILNLVVSGEKKVGLFGQVGGTVENLNIDGAKVQGINAVGTVCGLSYYGDIINCNVKNATVISSVKDGDDGDKVGGVVGRLSVEEGTGSVKNCTAENVTVQGLRQVGGVLGGAYKTSGSYDVSGNTAKNSTIIFDKTNVYSTYATMTDVREVIGTPEALNSANTATNVSILTMEADGLIKDAAGNYTITNANGMVAFANMVNSGTNFKNKTVKLAADIDLAGIAWTPIGGNNKRFEGTFDGQNHSIKNLESALDSSTGTKYGNGLFGDITGGATLKNFTVENANVYDKVDGKGNVYGIVCGYAYGTVTFENITVKNSKVTAFGKVGAILGMAADPGTSVTTIKNCKVEDTVITGGYNCATFAGLTMNIVSFSDNTQSGVTFKNASRSDTTESSYILLNTTTTSGETVNGKYWKYSDGYYYAAWANQYNEQKEASISGETFTIDAIVHN